MLILLEGPDGAGKSSLAQALNTRLPDATLLHAGPPTRHPLFEYETPIYWPMNYRPGGGRHVICDRWHLGETIYPRLLTRTSQLDVASKRHIELFLRSRGALLVLVTVDPDMLAERIDTRGDDLIKPEAASWLLDEYWESMRNSILPHVSVLGKKQEQDFNVDLIVSRAEAAEAQVTQLAPYTTYVGTEHPTTLLLGDTRNLATTDVRRMAVSEAELREHVRSPAFMPFPSTSGRYLLDSLAQLEGFEFEWQNIGIANACDNDDPYALWNTLGRPFTIVLGKHAGDRVGWGHHVDHPQFVRRFHHSERKAYAEWMTKGLPPPWRS
jgi:energy-coupling factor transporter ATP-binding protein EcfA2